MSEAAPRLIGEQAHGECGPASPPSVRWPRARWQSSRSTSSTTTSFNRNRARGASDHLVSGLVPLALLIGAAAFFGRLRAGARATIALLLGYFGVLAGTEAVYYTRAVGPSGDDFTGLLSVLAGLLLLGVGIVTLWTSRRTDDRTVVAIRPASRVRRRDSGHSCGGPHPLLDRLRRHACLARGGAEGRARGSLRGRRVHHQRRPEAEGLVHPVEERGGRDLVPRSVRDPERGKDAGPPRLRRPALRPSRRGRERGRPERVRVAGRA